jgi:hypothetical protein
LDPPPLERTLRTQLNVVKLAARHAAKLVHKDCRLRLRLHRPALPQLDSALDLELDLNLHRSLHPEMLATILQKLLASSLEPLLGSTQK